MAQRFDSEDDYNPHGEHVVELPAHAPIGRSTPRRSYATVGVAAFLALAGIGITVGLISDQSRRAKDEAAQREELRVGWQMLGTLAANGAAQSGTDAPAGAATAPPANTQAAPAAPNVVVVNVPAPAQPAAAQIPQQPSSAPNFNGVVQAQPTGAATPSAAQAAPSMGVLTQPIVGGTASAMNPSQLQPNGPAPASGAQLQPTGSVAASPPDQALPIGSVPAASDGVTFPASQMCGLSTCNTGSVCCNASCGICSAPGATCSQQPC